MKTRDGMMNTRSCLTIISGVGGDIRATTTGDFCNGKFTLKNALVAPRLPITGLLSVQRVLENPLTSMIIITKDKHCCSTQSMSLHVKGERKGHVFAKRSEKTDLEFVLTGQGYRMFGIPKPKLQLSTSASAFKANTNSLSTKRDSTDRIPIITLMARLGNMAYSTAKFMVLHNTVKGFYTDIPTLAQDMENSYGFDSNEAGIVGKLKNKSFKKSNVNDRRDKGIESFASNIHTDTWIFPKDTVGMHGEIGMQVFVDSATSSAWIRGIKRMKDIPMTIVTQLIAIEEECREIYGDGFHIQHLTPQDKPPHNIAQYRAVSRLRADRHPSHTSAELQSYLKTIWVVPDFTPTECHAANHKVERLIQELKKITKSLMSQVGFTKLLKSLLPYAAKAATRALDLWPHSSNKNSMSRREARTGTTGSVEELAPFFGATAYYRLGDDKRGAKVGIALETITNNAGEVMSYTVLDPISMAVHHVRTATFNERLSEYPTGAERLSRMRSGDMVHRPHSISLQQATTTDAVGATTTLVTAPETQFYFDTRSNRYYSSSPTKPYTCAYDGRSFNSQKALRVHFSSDSCAYDRSTRHTCEPKSQNPEILKKRRKFELTKENTIKCPYCDEELVEATPTGRTPKGTTLHIEKCKTTHVTTIEQRVHDAKKSRQAEQKLAQIQKIKNKYGERKKSTRNKTAITAMMIRTAMEQEDGMSFSREPDTVTNAFSTTMTQQSTTINRDTSPQYDPIASAVSIVELASGGDIMSLHNLTEGHDMTLRIARPPSDMVNPLSSEGYSTLSPEYSTPTPVADLPIQRDAKGNAKISGIVIPGVRLGTRDAYTPHRPNEVENSPLKVYWRRAEALEYQQLLDTNTIEVVPSGHIHGRERAIGSTMVYKLKFQEDGITIDKFKARLVALGFMQIAGRHYNKDSCSAPVARGSTFMLLIAVAVHQGLLLKQADVKGAYLISKIDSLIHIRLPNDARLFTINSGLYGLKQSGHLWNEEFTRVLTTIGFRRSTNDRCLYILSRMNNQGEEEKCWIAIWVDDILAAVSSESLWNEVYDKLNAQCPSTQDELRWLLGMKITDTTNGSGERTVEISQEPKITALLEQTGMTDCNTCKTPLPCTAALPDASDCPTTEEEERAITAKTSHPTYSAFRTEFREIIGYLSHLCEYGRPDLMQSVHYLARFQAHPAMAHYTCVKRIARYCKETKNMPMIFGNDKHPYSKEPLVGFVDSDYAGCKGSAKSTSGSAFLSYGTVIECKSRKQKCVTKSSTEAELVAASTSVCTALYLKRILEDDLCIPVGKVPIYEDNDACITIARNGSIHNRTRHIRVADAWIYQEVHDHGTIDIRSIDTKENIADMFTKSLPREAFEKHRGMLMGYVHNTKTYVATARYKWRSKLLNGQKLSFS